MQPNRPNSYCAVGETAFAALRGGFERTRVSTNRIFHTKSWQRYVDCIHKLKPTNNKKDSYDMIHFSVSILWMSFDGILCSLLILNFQFLSICLRLAFFFLWLAQVLFKNVSDGISGSNHLHTNFCICIFWHILIYDPIYFFTLIIHFFFSLKWLHLSMIIIYLP